MKFKALLLASFLVAGVSLSTSANAQDDQQKSQTPTTQTQPAAQPQSAPDQKSAPDQTQAQPADQSQPAATSQDQDQPAVAQTSDNKSDKDKKKEKKDKDSKKKGGKDDVDAIGNRKVAGWDWYSIESEIRMGKEYATQIESSLKMVTDPVVNE